MTDCPFCAIARDEAPARVIARTEHTAAFLDNRPVFKGHVLVIPTEHVITVPDLPDELLAPFFGEVRRIAGVLPEALGAQGTFVAMNNKVSQSVAHLHCHVVPRTKGDGLRGFFWPRVKYADGEQAGYAERLRTALAGE